MMASLCSSRSDRWTPSVPSRPGFSRWVLSSKQPNPCLWQQPCNHLLICPIWLVLPFHTGPFNPAILVSFVSEWQNRKCFHSFFGPASSYSQFYVQGFPHLFTLYFQACNSQAMSSFSLHPKKGIKLKWELRRQRNDIHSFTCLSQG